MKKFTSKWVFIILFFFLMFFSCTPIYIPNVINAPLPGQKGDFTTGLHGGTNGSDLQFSYAINDYLAVMLNGSYDKKNSNDTAFNDHYAHLYGEAGVGYYIPFGTSGRFDIFTGFGSGYGAADNEYLFIDTQRVFASGFYNRFFLQTDFGTSTEAFDGGLSLRATSVNFYKYKSDNKTTKHSVSQVFIEPALFGRIGFKWVKLQSQIGLAVPIGNQNFDDWQPLIFSMGVFVNLNFFGKDPWNVSNPH